jgi:hypothetical protein
MEIIIEFLFLFLLILSNSIKIDMNILYFFDSHLF